MADLLQTVAKKNAKKAQAAGASKVNISTSTPASAPAPAPAPKLAAQLQNIQSRIQSPVTSPRLANLDTPTSPLLDGVKKKLDFSAKTWSPKPNHMASPRLGSLLASEMMPSLDANIETFIPLNKRGPQPSNKFNEIRSEMETLNAVLSSTIPQSASRSQQQSHSQSQAQSRKSPRSVLSSPLSPRSPANHTPLFSPRERESVIDEDESGANDKRGGLFGDEKFDMDDSRIEEEAARIVAEAEAQKALQQAKAAEEARQQEELESRMRAEEEERRLNEEEKRRLMEEEVEKKRLQEEAEMKERKRLQEEAEMKERKRLQEEAEMKERLRLQHETEMKEKERRRLEEEVEKLKAIELKRQREEDERKWKEMEKKALEEERKKWESQERERQAKEEAKRKNEEEAKEKKRKEEEALARKKAADDAVAAILKVKQAEEAAMNEQLYRLTLKLEQEEAEKKAAEEKRKKEEIEKKKEMERLEKERKEEEERREREREIRLEQEIKKRTQENVLKALEEQAQKQKIEDEKKAAENQVKMQSALEEEKKRGHELAIKAAEVQRIEAMARRAAEEKERNEKQARRQKEIDARDRRHAMALLRTPTTVHLGSPTLDFDLDFDADFDDSESDRSSCADLDLLDDHLGRSKKFQAMMSPPTSQSPRPISPMQRSMSPVRGPVTTSGPLPFSPMFSCTPMEKQSGLKGILTQSPWLGSERSTVTPSQLLAGLAAGNWEDDHHSDAFDTPGFNPPGFKSPGFNSRENSPPLLPRTLPRGKGAGFVHSPHPSIAMPTRSIESVLGPPPRPPSSAIFTPKPANNFGMGSPPLAPSPTTSAPPEPSQIIMVSSPMVPGYTVAQNLGQCYGSAYIPVSLDVNLPALLNGEDERAQELIKAGRREAVKGLLKEAGNLGANGLINLRFSNPIPTGVSEVQFNASGMAVQLEHADPKELIYQRSAHTTPRNQPLPPSSFSGTPSPRENLLIDSPFSSPIHSRRPSRRPSISDSSSNLISPLTESPPASPPLTSLSSLTELLNKKPFDAWAPAKMQYRDSSPTRTPGGKGVRLFD